MHIPDGMLPVSVTLSGYAVSAAAIGFCLYKIKQRGDPRDEIPKAALLAAAFFVASLIHIPIPPTSVHLMLCGLMGGVLGYFAFPAIMVALFFQAVMFGHGGLTTLGVNGVILGVPALLSAFAFQAYMPSRRSVTALPVVAFAIGAVATALAVAIFALILFYTIPAHLDVALERSAIFTLVLVHVPVVAIDGMVTAFAVSYLAQARPRLLGSL